MKSNEETSTAIKRNAKKKKKMGKKKVYRTHFSAIILQTNDRQEVFNGFLRKVNDMIET